jgi:hypothetical protein
LTVCFTCRNAVNEEKMKVTMSLGQRLRLGMSPESEDALLDWRWFQNHCPDEVRAFALANKA